MSNIYIEKHFEVSDTRYKLIFFYYMFYFVYV